MARKNDTQNFEKSLAELEEIVTSMEQGDLSLEDSLNAFEKGVKLSKDCQKALKSAEQKVSKLVSKEEGAALEKGAGLEKGAALEIFSDTQETSR